MSERSGMGDDGCNISPPFRQIKFGDLQAKKRKYSRIVKKNNRYQRKLGVN
jgi:hypothetical protein